MWSTKREQVLWILTSGKENPTVSFFFFTPTTWQPDMANHSVRWPFSAIATHLPPPTPVMGQVPSAVSWTHGVIFIFWMTSCDGTVTALHDVAFIDIFKSISIYSALLLYIFYIYTVYCILAVCGVQFSMPFLAGICKWRADWLVDYNWKWPLTLCAIVSCALVMFYIFCGVCVDGCTVFSVSLLLYMHLNNIALQQVIIFAII